MSVSVLAGEQAETKDDCCDGGYKMFVNDFYYVVNFFFLSIFVTLFNSEFKESQTNMYSVKTTDGEFIW